ncbi:hypothetical protein P8452_45972 [Trifolium repens]|nr:hypothetical protein P8452_45972 [Trifolium repens]
MVAHQNRFGKDSEKIKAWKAALSEAADFEGYHIETGYEIDHIKEIVKKVEAKLGPKPFQTRQKLLNADNIWRLVGLVSSVVASPSSMNPRYFVPQSSPWPISIANFHGRSSPSTIFTNTFSSVKSFIFTLHHRESVSFMLAEKRKSRCMVYKGANCSSH